MVEVSEGTDILKFPNLSVPVALPEAGEITLANSIGWCVAESSTFPLINFCALLTRDIGINVTAKSIFFIIDIILSLINALKGYASTGRHCIKS
jgi:hypothetical protein